MPVTEPFQLLQERVAAHFGAHVPDTLGVGVSGGSDSLGLLAVLASWAEKGGPDLRAVTVDHGIRPESADEAAHVARMCERLGVRHDVLVWDGWDGAGNLPDQARRARYRLMTQWALREGVPQVAIAHTLNDQAETFLMRLSREAGVDGLAAMTQSWTQDGVHFRRPALALSRSELQRVLTAKGIAWVDDPTNTDMAFERARVRKVLETLEGLGLSARSLSNVANHMSELRETVYWYVFLAAQDCVRFQSGDVLLDRGGFRTLQRDIARRLVQQVLRWLSGADYAPRGRSVDLLLEAIRGGTTMTLHGCLMTVSAETLRFTREARAVSGLRAPVGTDWDGRWRLDGPWADGAEIAALGLSGLADCPNWRDTGLPAASLAASPAVWRGQRLIAAPLAGLRNGWQATLVQNENQFFGALLAR